MSGGTMGSYQDDLSELIQEETRCSTLDNVDTNKLRQDRFQRNLQTMMAADSEVAKQMFSDELPKLNSEQEIAAIVIQKFFRGHLGRKKYLTLLCEEFEKEQSIMQQKIKEQVEEGELLVENHQLEVLLDDNRTTRRNRSRHYLADIITIQRAWRAHRRKMAKMNSEDDTEKDNSTEKQSIQSSLLSGAIGDKSDSMSSSYSEISVSESSGQGLVNDKIENGQNLVPGPGESEDDFNKRLRKVNYLSLAQEFAELQRKNSETALDGANNVGSNPTCIEENNAKCESNGETKGNNPTSKVNTEKGVNGETKDNNPTSKGNTEKGVNSETKGNTVWNNPTVTGESESRTGSDTQRTGDTDREGDAFEVYTLETTFKPAFDWEDLEQKIQQASKSQSTAEQRNDRETIRKKLAMDFGAESSEMYRSQPSYKKPYTTKPANTNLQICFMNEEQEVSQGSSDTSSTGHKEVLNGSGISNSKPVDGGEPQGEDKNFLMEQVKLQQEAKIALAQASTMAHMQLEVEKEMNKKPISKTMVSMPFLESIKHNRVMKEELCVMNLGQLQVLVEGLHTQIENLNEDLMNLLMERDELHMSQDSMLVDIEDLTRRAEDTAKRS